MAQIAATDGLPPAALELAGRMYNAAREGQIDILQQALPAGLPANMTNEKGDTLLMLAAYHGHANIVRLLLEHGGDPNRLNDRGQSPLAGAVFKMENDVIEALLAGGADPDFGQPNAIACVRMFKQEDRWLSRFESAPGRGKMAAQGLGDGVHAETTANGEAPVANGGNGVVGVGPDGHVPMNEGELEEAYTNR